ncbi:MAG: tRNA-intron lyase, partial [Candidatus Pacearchaeota archaeon]
ARLINENEKNVEKEEVIKKFLKKDKNFLLKYLVFEDLRKRGYILKSALKFGADFRVYDKGFKSKEKHSKWLLSVFSEHEKINLKDFSSKNRVAHSTNKKFMIAIVDDEKGITYYEINWMSNL